MPGFIKDKNALGMKIIDIYPDNIEKGLVTSPSTMILIDKDNGFVKAILDGTILTRLRTGAVSGAATEVLSNEDARYFLLIGTGGQAGTQLEAVLAVRDIEEAYVFDVNYERAEAFAKEMNEKLKGYGAKILAIKELDEVLGDVDIITTVTTSKKPVFDGNKVKKGVHVNSVGSYTPDMQETPPISKEKVAHELGDLLLGREVGRESKEEITWFKTVGFAGLDLVAGEKIYQLAKEKGIGTKIEM